MQTGCCQCGDVEYEFDGTPITCVVCHCTDCQKGSGSAFSISLVVQRDNVQVVSGKVVEDAFRLNDNDIVRARCVRCGTGLWYGNPTMPAIVALKPGTLKDTSQVRPIAHCWTRSAQPWVSFGADMKRFETQPSIEELVGLWQQQNG